MGIKVLRASPSVRVPFGSLLLCFYIYFFFALIQKLLMLRLMSRSHYLGLSLFINFILAEAQLSRWRFWSRDAHAKLLLGIYELAIRTWRCQLVNLLYCTVLLLGQRRLRGHRVQHERPEIAIICWIRCKAEVVGGLLNDIKTWLSWMRGLLSLPRLR